MILANIEAEHVLFAGCSKLVAVITGLCAQWLADRYSLRNWRKQRVMDSLAEHCANIEYDLICMEAGRSRLDEDVPEDFAAIVSSEARIRVLEPDPQLGQALAEMRKAATPRDSQDFCNVRCAIEKAYQRVHKLYFN